jgi:hypothetical protein
MAAGRTNNVLTILVAAQFREHPAVKELEAKGHQVISAIEDIAVFDLILSPNAHFWNDMMWDFLPAALTAARKRKKERGQ